MSFWQDYKRPIMALAPMEEVTDTVFRELIMGISSPENLNLLYTEFVSTDGLCHDQGRERVIHRLQCTDSETTMRKDLNIPLLAQIWGTNPENYYKAVQMIDQEFNFDGIDINMGCPVGKIIKKGACSGLIRNPSLAKEIVQACQEASNLPVSVKTRIGFNEVVTESWISELLSCKPEAIGIHGRIQAQQSNGLADWNEIGKAVALRDEISPKTRILGNGDVESMEDGLERVAKHNLDGALIARGIFHDRWLFAKEHVHRDAKERMRLLWKHSQMFTDTWGDRKNFFVLRRFYKIYAAGFVGAVKTRVKLLEMPDLASVEAFLKEHDVFE